MPLSAVDAIGPAFQHTKKQLIQPFRFGQWARLAFVGILAGELSSGGGCNTGGTNFQIPQHPRGAEQFIGLALPASLAHNPALLAGLIIFVIVFGLLFFLLFTYLNSVMRFILFDSIIGKECRVREGWAKRQRPGLRYFLWQLLVMAITLGGLTILVGIPAGFAFAVGWLKAPKEHLLPLILGGIGLFFVFLLFMLVLAVVHVVTKDFVVPQMALEDIGAIEGWRRLWPTINAEKGGYAGYIGMKIVMSLGAAVVVGIVAGVLVLVLLVPVGGLGVVAVLTGKTAGLTWNVYTITLIVLGGCLFLAVLIYAIGLVSVPVIVFFPAYSIYFFASRYPALAAVLYPAPPAPSNFPAPPEPPPLPPTPASIG